MPSREPLLSRTFVQLADSLVDQFDLIELLTLLSHRCVELFGAGAAGILLADQRGTLQVVAASSEQARLLELFQLQNDEGPCLECFSTGAAITVHDLSSVAQWPLFVSEARAAGYQGVCAFPLRLRDDVIGTLNIFMVDPVVLGEQDLQICQALADVATAANVHVAAALGISHRTVGKHLERGYRKLGVSDRSSAAARVWELSGAS